jgi:hypothetical protein
MDLLLLYEAVACERDFERERAEIIHQARAAIALDRANARTTSGAARPRATAPTQPVTARATAPPRTTAEG